MHAAHILLPRAALVAAALAFGGAGEGQPAHGERELRWGGDAEGGALKPIRPIRRGFAASTSISPG